jgi:hypothetical protein
MAQRRGMAVAAVIGTVEKRRPMMNVAAKQTFQQSFDQEAATIEIRLSRPQQLFNSLDPSPFHDRDLDQDAEDYLVDSADEYPLKKPLIVIIHAPADHLPPCSMPDLGQAIHNYESAESFAPGRRIDYGSALVICQAVPWGDRPKRRICSRLKPANP